MYSRAWGLWACHVTRLYGLGSRVASSGLGASNRVHIAARFQATVAGIPQTTRIGHFHSTISNATTWPRRGISWSSKARAVKLPEPAEVPDDEEDAARAAILDKVMKGRQPADLMLRCRSLGFLFTYRS